MVYQQFRRWDEAGCFEAMVNDMRSIIRVSEGRRGQRAGERSFGWLSRFRRLSRDFERLPQVLAAVGSS
ncbi:MAG: hypothetical protein RL654_2282 [Pseudomonadota bacterium]|jgi:transposase